MNMINITEYFSSIGLLATLATVITGYLNTHVSFLKGSNATIKQIVSWMVSIALAFIGHAKGVGIVADTDVLWTAVTGVSVGLVANGIFDIKLVQAMLTFIKANNKKA